MKKILFFCIAILLALNSTTQAQDNEQSRPKGEKLKALKIAYLTRELDLSSTEAEQFWPLYNELSMKMRTIKKEKRSNAKTTRQNFANMTDKELSAAIDLQFALRQNELDLKKAYSEKFKAVLPIRKVVKLISVEERFKQELLRSARDRNLKNR